MLDLGVSAFQLDTPKRGFTYRSEDAPLDMRMDDRNALTARDIVNTYSENDPVSYTHLDVYKRQLYYEGGCLKWHEHI